MEVRNSAGHRVSLLNDDASTSTFSRFSADKQSGSSANLVTESGRYSSVGKQPPASLGAGQRLPPFVALAAPHHSHSTTSSARPGCSSTSSSSSLTSSSASAHAHTNTNINTNTTTTTTNANNHYHHRRQLPATSTIATINTTNTTTAPTAFAHRSRPRLPTNSHTYSYSSTRSSGSTSSVSSTGSSRSRSPPNTPPLERSDSRDSDMMMNGSLSPSTPTYADYDATLAAAAGVGVDQQHVKSMPGLSSDLQQRSGPYFGATAPMPTQFPVAGHALAGQVVGGEWFTEASPLSPPFGANAGYALHQAVVPGVAPYPLAQQLGDAQALAVMSQQTSGPYAQQAPPLSSPMAAETPDRRSSNVKGKGNKFPCPLASQYNCSDTFTTSGHAARHAKKHTGKKDAICPECKKAFTRKDNMEQHRRTHKNGKNQASRTSEDGASQPQHSRKASTASVAKSTTAGASPRMRAGRPSSLVDPNAMMVGGMQEPFPTQPFDHVQIDPALPVSPTSSFGMPSGQFPLPVFDQHSLAGSSYPDPTGLGVGYSPLMRAGAFGTGMGEQSPIMSGTHGLEALSEAAAAASNSSEEDLSLLRR